MKAKLVNYLDMERAISKPYLYTEDVMIVALCGENKARALMREIIKEESEQGNLTYRQRPMMVATDLVLAKVGLSASKIRKEAEHIRKSGISTASL